MKKLFAVMALCFSSAVFADGGFSIKPCVDQASGLTYTEQLMSFTSCLRTVKSTRAKQILECIDGSVGDNLNETMGMLQFCILSIDRPVYHEHLMSDSVTCIRTARGNSVPAVIDTAKRCLNKLPL